MTYSDKLKDPRWQKKRLAVLDRDGWCCRMCGDAKTTLHVHHKKYNGNPWDSKIDDLETLCENCHAVREFNKEDVFDIIHTYKVVFEDGSKSIFVKYLDEDGEICIDIYRIRNGILKHQLIITDSLFFRLLKSFYPEYQIEQNG